MHNAVPVLSVGFAQVNYVAIEYFAIFLIPVNHLNHGLLGFGGVVESRTAIACLHACSIVLIHQCAIFVEVFAKRLEGGFLASAVIFNQRHEAPQRRWYALPGAVVIELTGVNELAVARQRPVGFAVANRHLGGAV